MNEQRERIVETRTGQFGEEIKRAIRNSGKNQIVVAEEIGISPASFNAYIRGRREPPLWAIVAIADCLHLDAANLFCMLAGAAEGDSKDQDATLAYNRVVKLCREYASAWKRSQRKEIAYLLICE